MKVKKIAILFLLPILLACFLSVTFAHTVPVLNDGLIGYWKFDEGSGAVAIDSMGVNNGTIINATYVNGVWGYGLKFDGDNDNVLVENPNILSSQGTLNLWINASVFNAENGLFSYFKDWNNYFLFLTDGVSGICRMYNGGVDISVSEVLANFNTNTNYMLTISQNGTYLNFYVDSVLVASHNENKWLTSCGLDSTSDIEIGLFQTFTDFNGTIDDVRLYNHALTQSEITYLFNGEPDTTPTPAPTATPFPEGDMSNTDWWISILVLLLIIINIFLMMLPFALVRFTFGILSLFLCMLALSYQIPLSPYLQTAGLLISALAMLFSVRARE